MFDRRGPAATEIAAQRSRWRLSLGLFLEVVASSIALIGLIGGRDWWLALLGTALLLLAVPAALRAVGLGPRLALFIDVAVFALQLQLVYGLGSTPELFHRALLAIQNQRTPAQPLPELIFFIVLFGGVMAIVLDLLAVVLRIPAVTGVVLGGVLVVPAVLQENGLSLVALGAGAAAWFALLAADGRVRHGSRGGGAVGFSVAASATVIALVVAATAPGFVEQGRLPQVGPVSIGNSVNPLIDLGADLRRPTPVDVLRYTTNSKTPEYLQLTTLDNIHGTDWSHASGALTPLKHGTDLGSVPGFDSTAGYSAKQVTTTIDVQSLRSGWIPAPYPVTKISGSRGARAYDGDDLTIFATGGALSGESYRTTSLDLEPTVQQLTALGDVGYQGTADMQRDLYLPSNVPPIITETAQQIASSAAGPSELDLARAIQDFFQDSANDFTYSTNSPDTIDGASLDVIAKFLQVREGYCVHFASAMAVIARVLGIPSRIAMGYLPGVAISTAGGKTTYQVDSSDLHAWPQLYFPGVGWLNFEPTVSRGSLPSYTQDTPTVSDPAGTDEVQQAPTETPKPKQTQGARDIPSGQTPQASAQTAAATGGVHDLGALALLIVFAIPALVRQLRRRRRLWRLRRPGAPPGDAWDEIRDTARDLGFAASTTETPRAFAARLRSDWHPDASHQRDLDEILRQVELARFGPPRAVAGGTGLAERTVSVTAAMRASRHWTTRLLAATAPRSLLATFERARVDV